MGAPGASLGQIAAPATRYAAALIFLIGGLAAVPRAVLAAGLWRGRAVPAWTAAVPAATFASMAGLSASGGPVTLVSYAPMLAASPASQ
jgi:hypothetical protein